MKRKGKESSWNFVLLWVFNDKAGVSVVIKNWVRTNHKFFPSLPHQRVISVKGCLKRGQMAFSWCSSKWVLSSLYGFNPLCFQSDRHQGTLELPGDNYKLLKLPGTSPHPWKTLWCWAEGEAKGLQWFPSSGAGWLQPSANLHFSELCKWDSSICLTGGVKKLNSLVFTKCF